MIEVHGHRGARGLFPENSLSGIEGAVRLGLDSIELDVAVTRDRQVVLFHDLKLNPDLVRDADGGWLDAPLPAIHELTLEELGRFDIGAIRPGTGYARSFPRQRSIDGERIPTLEQAIAAADQATPGPVGFNIEIKSSPLEPQVTLPPAELADIVVREVRRLAIGDRTTLQSFHWSVVDRIKVIAPEIVTSRLTSEDPEDDTVLRDGKTPSPWLCPYRLADTGGSLPALVNLTGSEIWSPCFPDLTADDLGAARRLGLKVIVWTVNEPADMRRLARWGVDGIISDYPDTLRGVLGELGLTVPPRPARD